MSTIKLDNLYTHSKNVAPGYTHNGILASNILGTFCGSPIVTMDSRAVDIDNIVEAARIIEENKGGSTYTAEVMPGELVCTDSIVRRGTSAEALGYDELHAYDQPKGTTKVSIPVAREYQGNALVDWRPDHVVGTEEFALVYTEGAQ